MIFLRDNVLLDRELTTDDVKPRLLGEYSYLWYMPQTNKN